MPEYVARITLTVNGVDVQDFNSITEKEVELHKPVKLMRKTGFVTVTPRYAVQVEYVLPKDAPAFDWEAVAAGTLIVDREDGTPITYTDVYVEKVGEIKADGEKEATQQIDLIALGRNK